MVYCFIFIFIYNYVIKPFWCWIMTFNYLCYIFIALLSVLFTSPINKSFIIVNYSMNIEKDTCVSQFLKKATKLKFWLKCAINIFRHIETVSMYIRLNFLHFYTLSVTRNLLILLLLYFFFSFFCKPHFEQKE